LNYNINWTLWLNLWTQKSKSKTLNVSYTIWKRKSSMSSTFCMHGPVEKKQRMKLIMKEREIEKGNVYIWKVLARWSSWSENQNTLKEMAGSLFSLQIIVSLLFIFLFLLEAVHGTKKVGLHAIYFNYLMFLVSKYDQLCC
jgi:hypothetical protein